MDRGSEQAAWFGKGQVKEGYNQLPPQTRFLSLTWFPASEGGWEERGPINEVGKWSLQ